MPVVWRLTGPETTKVQEKQGWNVTAQELASLQGIRLVPDVPNSTFGTPLQFLLSTCQALGDIRSVVRDAAAETLAALAGHEVGRIMMSPHHIQGQRARWF